MSRQVEISIELRALRPDDDGNAWGGMDVRYRVERGRRQTFSAELQPGMTLAQLLVFVLQVIDAGERPTGETARVGSGAVVAGAAA